jgi:HSP20 family protein
MSLVKRNTNDLFNGMPTLFNDFVTRDLWDWGLSNNSTTNTSIPAVNIRETADAFEVEMAAPGMNKEDFRIELDNNMLTISSEREHRNEQKEGERYARREFSYQSFQRTFHLSKNVVDADKIQAKYENGLLHLTIPKREEAKQRPPKTIQIS